MMTKPTTTASLKIAICLLSLCHASSSSTLRGGQVAAAHRQLTFGQGVMQDFAAFDAGDTVTELDNGMMMMIAVMAQKRGGVNGTGPLVNAAAKIFDSSHPTGGDFDLGTPHQNFGGPGLGHAGKRNSLTENAVARGNILVISEHANDVDPIRFGGNIVFKFAAPVIMDEMGMLDMDKKGATFAVKPVAGGPWQQVKAGRGGDNSFEIIALDERFGNLEITELKVVFARSGAITHFKFHLATAMPSSLPSERPSELLTATPMAAPTALPSDVPTSVPSDMPTDTPSIMLSTGPTAAPTMNPSTATTLAPSIESCKVLRLVLWDADTDTELFDITDGDDFCGDDLPRNVNFEAITDACVSQVKMQIKDEFSFSRSKTEKRRPFFLAGNERNGSPKSMRLPPSSMEFEVTLIPDNDRALKKVISFTVSDASCIEQI